MLIKIGKGKSAWKVGNFYSEYRKIGKTRSETEAEQAKRLEKFIESTERASRAGNGVITGDFNIKIDSRSMDPSNQRLIDMLLDSLPSHGFVQIALEMKGTARVKHPLSLTTSG